MAIFEGGRDHDLDGGQQRRPLSLWLYDALTLAMAGACCAAVLGSLSMWMMP